MQKQHTQNKKTIVWETIKCCCDSRKKCHFKMEIHVNNICSLIQRLDINDDSIVQNRKIKDICQAQDFQSVTGEDHMLK